MTPWVAILSTMALTLVLVVWLARGTWNDPFTYFAFMATTATFGILTVYILIALGGMLYFLRNRQASDVAYNIGFDLLLPVGAIVICGLTIYWSIFPRPPAPISYAPWVAGGWLLLGLALLAWLNVRSPEKVAAFGSVLAEGGEPVEAMPAAAPGAIAKR